ncbi:transporter [Geomesophilobacter sediminis]|uniref:Transporter n=1 Tax=Geomesophilobacter sediminis TaxID=2798584 RepID=A0A8J7JA57_9BACT|nr:transporter [Geomesophilobacter sediminis]MBJ6723128.1 transporter [Geomesophilobacter sediminis]
MLGALILFVLGQPARSQAGSGADAEKKSRVAAEVGFDVATGSYGNPTSTTTVAVPFSLSYLVTPRFDLGLSIPYLWQSNEEVVGGKPVRSGKLVAARGAAPAAPPMMGGGSSTVSASRTRAVSGLGDLLLSAGYTLLPETDGVPELRAVAGLKVPTADSGLGTGAVDGVAGFTSSKWLGNWYLYLDGDYTVQGRTSLYNARNYFGYDLGVGYEVLPGLRTDFGIKGMTATEEGTGAGLQLEAKVLYVLSRRVFLKTYLDRGLTTWSPDWQGGGAVSISF